MRKRYLPERYEPTWLESLRDAIVFLVAMYALYWLLTLGCVGVHGAKACGV